MLYDPKWERKVETKADPFTLESLIAWLETKDPQQTYDFWNCTGGCLWDQYLGRNSTSSEYSEITDAFNAMGFSAARNPRTFGAALDRARAALASA